MISPSFLKLSVLIRLLQVCAAVLVAMLVYIIFLILENSRLELAIANQDLLIIAQSSAITRWKDEADFKQRNAHDALRKAEKMSEEADRRIAEMRKAPVFTCTEGIELIDKALGL